MPELPEVETIRRDLDRSVRGLTILKVQVNDSRVIRQDEAGFRRRVEGRTIRAVSRRGKAVIMDLGEGCLIVQPMMTGQLIAHPAGKVVPRLKETHLVFTLSKGISLVYNDQRLFGRLEAVDTPHAHAHVRGLGPEPLEADFTVEVLARALHGRRRAVKVVLLDSKVVAGIGNIYASEILFRAGIRPARKAASLTRRRVARLHQAVRDVLNEAVRMRGTSMRNYRDGEGREGKYVKIIKVYGREGQPCRVCGAPVRRIVQAQRSTFFCGTCQR